MAKLESTDYYAILQVSPGADADTINHVFRLLAKRYHPDNLDSGDPDRFAQLVEAFRILSDPERRAGYDARYRSIQEDHWRLFDQQSTGDIVEEDRRLRGGILAALYAARRNDVSHPGMGILELERLMGCPKDHMTFHVWYLKENGWLERLDNGKLAITASGVDRLMELGTPWQEADARRLTAGIAGPPEDEVFAAAGSSRRRRGS